MTTPENPQAATFLRQARDQFAELSNRGHTIARYFTVAGLVVRVDAASGPVARAMCRALSHLAADAVAEPDLVISTWDSVCSGAAELRAPWSIADYGNYGLIEGFNDSRFYTSAQFDPALILGMLDQVQGQAIYWMRDVGRLPVWERGAPFRPVLHEWLRRLGHLPVHGGAVGRADGGVFLAGAGGSGKSNVALACLESDLSYASDDFCVLTDEPHWRVHSLYGTGKLSREDLVRHPLLVERVSNPDAPPGEKALFFLSEHFRDRLIGSMPIKAILIPKVTDSAASEIVPASGAQAMRAIAISTMEMSGWTGGSVFSDVARFVRAQPCYTLRIGRDFQNVPTLISGLLNRAI